jgi:hypothetical protein
VRGRGRILPHEVIPLAVLLLTGRIEGWHVFVTAFISGGSMAFNQPTRQSLIPRIVPAEIMLNAISLNTAAMNLMRILGAGLAGILLIFLDYGQVYLLNGVISLYVIWTTTQIALTEHSPAPGVTVEPAAVAKTSILHDLLEGFRYMAANRGVFYLAGMALVLSRSAPLFPGHLRKPWVRS